MGGSSDPPYAYAGEDMAEGIRIRHRLAKNATVVVRDVSRPIPNPRGIPWPGCSRCNIPSPGHGGFKTTHVNVDHDGYAIVSPGIWEQLKRFIDLGGFEYSNPVPEPPKQQINWRNGGFVVRTLHKIQPNIRLDLLKGTTNGDGRNQQLP